VELAVELAVLTFSVGIVFASVSAVELAGVTGVAVPAEVVVEVVGFAWLFGSTPAESFGPSAEVVFISRVDFESIVSAVALGI